MITLHQDADGCRSFEVGGIGDANLEGLAARTLGPREWQRIFSVFVGHAPASTDTQRLPMLGAYRVEARLIRFTPRYPLMEGQAYSAVLDLGALPAAAGGAPSSRRITAVFDVPRPDAPTTRVIRIYPSAAVLPENLLRFHVCFSAPMRDGEALKHIHLSTEGGQPVEGVFLDTLSELWDSTLTRLTLLFDPGRVKSGLGAHGLLGRALRAGESYRLVVDQGYRDARGDSLASSFEKLFLVSSATSAAPRISAWALTAPAARTRAVLTARLPAPLDHALLIACVRIRGPAGGELRGEIRVEQEETAWHFLPRDPWEPGRYTLEVEGRLEDVAGNNLDGLFDRPVGQGPALGGEKVASLFFEVE